MNWTPTGTNPLIVEAFDNYRSFLLRIATLYAGARLIEAVDLSALGDSFALAISDDLPEGATTVRTVGELKQSIQSREYGQLALALGTIQLCTAFEILLERISAIYGVEVDSTDRFDVSHTPVAGAPPVIVTLGNRALMQINKLHQQLSVSSPLNRPDTLLKLAAIVEARNCFTHAGGIVQKLKQKERLWAYRIPAEVGQPLVLKDNALDDFLHFMALNALAFVDRAP
ncbi:MAG TPA: hypothetical protein VJN68_11795 [Burkholderiaceae bacterium]|nr:hypothetical protein [Burkholderiaceae bacterium]